MKLRTGHCKTRPKRRLCYHDTFNYSKWKPLLALLITRNVHSQPPSKNWELKDMPSRSHKAYEQCVFSLFNQYAYALISGKEPNYLHWLVWIGEPELWQSNFKRKRMCKSEGIGWRKVVFLRKWSWTFREMVQSYTHTAIDDCLSGIWMCTDSNTHAQCCRRSLRAHCVLMCFVIVRGNALSYFCGMTKKKKYLVTFSSSKHNNRSCRTSVHTIVNTSTCKPLANLRKWVEHKSGSIPKTEFQTKVSQVLVFFCIIRKYFNDVTKPIWASISMFT